MKRKESKVDESQTKNVKENTGERWEGTGNHTNNEMCKQWGGG